MSQQGVPWLLHFEGDYNSEWWWWWWCVCLGAEVVSKRMG